MPWLIWCILDEQGTPCDSIAWQSCSSKASISVAFWLAAVACCEAEPAHFWLSASNVSPGGPDAPTINVPNNGSAQLYIWGRPTAAKKVENLSLNIIAMQAGIDFLDTGIVVHNDIIGQAQRFELVSHSSSVPAVRSTRTRTQVLAGQTDSIPLARIHAHPEQHHSRYWRNMRRW
jgi:hypothetical protein